MGKDQGLIGTRCGATQTWRVANRGLKAAVGDDATGKSSTIAYQSEQTLSSLGAVFHPRSTHDIIRMGLHAFALSRAAGCCVGMKIVVDTVDTSSVIDLNTIRPTHFDDDNDEPVKILTRSHWLLSRFEERRQTI